MTTPQFEVRPERAEDIDFLRSLAARSFGPGRFARSAHRIREKSGPLEKLSLVATTAGQLAGSIRFTPVKIGGKQGALVLGPLIVEDVWAGKGCGRALIARGLELAGDAGYTLVLLVGDESYYGKFGFGPVPAGRIVMPGPVDPARLLAMELVPNALGEYEGPIGPDH